MSQIFKQKINLEDCCVKGVANMLKVKVKVHIILIYMPFRPFSNKLSSKVGTITCVVPRGAIFK